MKLKLFAVAIVLLLVLGCSSVDNGDNNPVGALGERQLIDTIPVMAGPPATEGDTVTSERQAPNMAAGSRRSVYYMRYLVYDRNEGDYDYVYVFRLPINYCPAWVRLYYRPKGVCWPSGYWWFGADYRRSYYQNGNFYIEYLIGKGKVDNLTCYGYFELEYPT